MASQRTADDAKQIGSRGKTAGGTAFDRRYAKAKARKKPRISRLSR